MTIALPAHAERRFGIDLSRPVLYSFAAILCVLIILPISWLLLYSLTDANGSFTLGNFYRLFTESSFIDPLITTFILATSSAIICCAVAAPMGWLVARTDLPFSGDHPRIGDGFVRDAAVPRRNRLGIAGGTQ